MDKALELYSYYEYIIIYSVAVRKVYSTVYCTCSLKDYWYYYSTILGAPYTYS